MLNGNQKGAIIGAVRTIKRSKDEKGINLLTNLYKTAYADGANEIIEDIDQAIKEAKGVGEVTYKNIMASISEKFEHHPVVEIVMDEEEDKDEQDQQ